MPPFLLSSVVASFLSRMTHVVVSALTKARRRLLPFLFLLYVVSYLDRINVGFAALQMNDALGFSSVTYSFGAGIFFLSYTLLEVPSNVILARVGARLWIARIMITWGIVSAAMMPPFERIAAASSRTCETATITAAAQAAAARVQGARQRREVPPLPDGRPAGRPVHPAARGIRGGLRDGRHGAGDRHVHPEVRPAVAARRGRPRVVERADGTVRHRATPSGRSFVVASSRRITVP